LENESGATGNLNGVPITLPLGTHTYLIINQFGNSCWGEFTVEDKLPPVINCNCPGPEPTTQFTGQLTLTSPRLNRANSSTAGTCTQNTVGTNVRYTTFPLQLLSQVHILLQYRDCVMEIRK
jgi:hypothetical protein